MDLENTTTLQEEWKKDMKSLKRSLGVNRVINIISSLLSITVIIVLVIVIGKVDSFREELTPAINKISEIDVQQVNAAIENFNVMMEEFDMEEINAKFESVDLEAIGEIVESINPEELEKTLNNINSVSERLKTISDKISRLFGVSGTEEPEE